ncbi:MAG: ComEA family DNA-binding protein [Anaerolineales bacterium]|nr:MAG: ComEA family DNA-binding protein [Anaerolineales bacterium]
MKILPTKSWWQLAIGILGGLLGAAILLLFNSQPRGEAVSILPPPSPAPIRVHVTGAVSNPDVYSLPPGSRVQDAVDAAGGVLPNAYTYTLNLAARLEDGDKVLVPFIAQDTSENPQEKRDKPATASVQFPLDINTATQEELELLPGIGESKAQAIIEYRETNGPFTTIEQIQNVPGIGPGIFEDIKDLIIVDSNP